MYDARLNCSAVQQDQFCFLVCHMPPSQSLSLPWTRFILRVDIHQPAVYTPCFFEGVFDIAASPALSTYCVRYTDGSECAVTAAVDRSFGCVLHSVVIVLPRSLPAPPPRKHPRSRSSFLSPIAGDRVASQATVGPIPSGHASGGERVSGRAGASERASGHATGERVSNHASASERASGHAPTNERAPNHATANERTSNHAAANERAPNHASTNERAPNHATANERTSNHATANERTSNHAASPRSPLTITSVEKQAKNRNGSRRLQETISKASPAVYREYLTATLPIITKLSQRTRSPPAQA